MKRGVVVINTSRGASICEQALLKGLRSSKIAVAGFDVYEKEPYSGALLDLDNVVATAHMGSYAKEARIAMEIAAVKNLLKGVRSNRGN